MNIIINNETFNWNPDSNSLYQLLLSVELYAEKGIAVAVNNEVVPRKQWNEFSLSEGYTVTIIRASQGG